MKVNTYLAVRLFALGLCLAAAGGASAAAKETVPQDKPAAKPAASPQPKVPEAEMKAAQAVQSAPDAQAALTAAEAFVGKHGKSVLRPRMARFIAEKIGEVKDPAQQIALAESYNKIFNAPEESSVIRPYMIEAYIAAKRLDDAFPLATLDAVERFDDPVATMINLSIIAAEQTQRSNPKFVQQGRQLGLKAIEMIEANRKPAVVGDAGWAIYKSKWLPQLYHSLGLLSFTTGDAADAKVKLAKARELNSVNPYTYVAIGVIANNEYQQLAQQHKAAAAGAARDELLKSAQAQMDQVIDAYARAIALTDGQAAYDPLRTQLMQDLEAYFKYRNNGSAEGMQKLIDKYKKPVEPKLP